MEIKRGYLVWNGKPHYDERGVPTNIVVVQDSSKGIDPMTGELKRINPSTAIEADKKTYMDLFEPQLYDFDLLHDLLREKKVYDKDEVKNLEFQIKKHEGEIKKLNEKLIDVLQKYISIEDCRKAAAKSVLVFGE